MCPAITLPDDGSEPKTFAEMQERHRAAHKRLWAGKKELFGSDPPKSKPILSSQRIPPPPIRVFEPEPEPWPVRSQTSIIASPKPSIQLIIKIVSSYMRLSVDQIKGERRYGDYCHARQLIYYLCREMLSKSFPSIGAAIGGRDHTTILCGAKKFTKRLANGDAKAISDLNQIKGLLGCRLSTLPVVTCADHDNDNRVGNLPDREVREAPS